MLILDVHRQVLATNDRVLEVVDPKDGSPLGRRPGELFGCVHVPEGPDGCGTSHACAHCGAVLAILEAQRTGQAIHSECLLTLPFGGLIESAEFEIVASPLTSKSTTPAKFPERTAAASSSDHSAPRERLVGAWAPAG